MLPKYHALFGIIFAGIIFLTFPKIGLLGLFIIWASSVLVDVDHYLFYVMTEKDLNLKNAYKSFNNETTEFFKLSLEDRKKIKEDALYIFHGVETLVILLVLFFFLPLLFSTISLLIFLGVLFHNILDLVYAIFVGYPLEKMGLQTINFLNYKKNKDVEK